MFKNLLKAASSRFGYTVLKSATFEAALTQLQAQDRELLRRQADIARLYGARAAAERSLDELLHSLQVLQHHCGVLSAERDALQSACADLRGEKEHLETNLGALHARVEETENALAIERAEERLQARLERLGALLTLANEANPDVASAGPAAAPLPALLAAPIQTRLATTKPAIIVVGTGRDGTVSMQEFLSHLFAQEGAQRDANHEFANRECYNCVDAFVRNNDPAEIDTLRRALAGCPFDAIVGNGYALAFRYVPEVFPRDAAFIHLKRRDRAACIASWVKHTGLFPESDGNYSTRSDVDFHIRRMAAFHLGEMSEEAWRDLPIEEKFAWYYDRTHDLIDEMATHFPKRMEVYTEDLSDPARLAAIADFVGIPLAAPAPTFHKNAFTYCDIADFDPFWTPRAQWIYSRFDFQRAVQDPVYPLEYFCSRFVSWFGYLLWTPDKGEMERYVQPPAQVHALLGEAATALRKWLPLFEEFMLAIQQRHGVTPEEKRPPAQAA